MAAKGPLAGVRVLDFGWAWAGPYGCTLLAFLGAEVIKIEGHRRPDYSRRMSMTTGQAFDNLDQSTVFNDMNLNKLGLAVDLTRPRGVALVKDLVSISDVVMGNMRPGTMEKLGLGYEELRRIKPDIIMCWSSAAGGTGPYRGYVGYAPTFALLGGISHLTRYPDTPPTLLSGSIDARSGTTFGLAALLALNYRLRTGQGQFVDLSSTEAIAVFSGHAILDYAMNGRIEGPIGNEDEAMAPHNVYPCKDADTWITIAVATEEEWRQLVQALGDPAWAQDDRFADGYGRWSHRQELDRHLEAWTRQRTDYEAMAALQGAGVAAVPSLDNRKLYEDPHTRSREVFTRLRHPAIGERIVMGPPWKLATTPAQVIRPAPLLGQHTGYVLQELLGLPEPAAEELRAEGVVYEPEVAVPPA
ncbi:MAG: CoA transferase [Chloroflexi bacterium]|nr:CoA transferase [Chloroflexota bacterium]